MKKTKAYYLFQDLFVLLLTGSGVWVLTMLIIGCLVTGCTLSKKLTRTGFDRSVKFSMGGYFYSVDRKETFREDSNGNIRMFRNDDPKIGGILEAAGVVKGHKVAGR